MQINKETLALLARDVGQEMYPLILDQFRQEFTELSAQLADLDDGEALPALAECAHRLKSTSATLGLEEFSQQAARTESAARAGATENAEAARLRLMELAREAAALLETPPDVPSS